MQKRFSHFEFVRLIAVSLIGILAVATFPASATQSVTLAWNPSTNADVAGYNIYYGTTSGDYTNVLSVGNITNVTVSSLVDGVTYYFAAKSRSASGVESGFSNEASYAVPTAAASLTSSVRSSHEFSFTVNGVSGYEYVVQASTNMVDWVSLETNTAPFLFIDPNANQFPQRFYRSVHLP